MKKKYEVKVMVKIGKHKLENVDIFNEEKILKLVGNDKVDIYYTDMPWGDANIKYWHTINKKMNNIEYSTPSYTFEDFMRKVFKYASMFSRKWVVIECGKRFTETVKRIAGEFGLYHIATVETMYKSGGKLHPMDVVVFRVDKHIELDLSPAYHTHGYKTVKAVFDQLIKHGGEMKSGMDLCCGLGYTARACIENGMRFIGNELNKKRLKKTIELIKKKEGIKDGEVISID